MVTDVDAVTALVVTVNVALALPAGTVTLSGTVATDVLLLDKDTTTSIGAGSFMVTVPWDVLPPTTLVGSSVTESTSRGATVKLAFFVTPP
jgi:hypothetical protein